MKRVIRLRTRTARTDDQMVAYVCPRCHRVRYFPIGTESYEIQPDGSHRRRICHKCFK